MGLRAMRSRSTFPWHFLFFLPFLLIIGGLNMALTLILYRPVVTALRKATLAPESRTTTPDTGSKAGFLLFSLAQRRTAERDAFRRTAEQLVALFEDEYPGIKVTVPEARMILGYHTKSDYPLKLDVIGRRLIRFDSQGVDPLEELNGLPDVITFCADINFDMAESEKANPIEGETLLKKLKADLKHLDRIIEFMSQ